MVNIYRTNIVDLPVNISLGYIWCGGFILGVFILCQIISGVLLSFFYIPSGVHSFFVVYGILSDGFITWVIRYMHIWGVSLIFVSLYLHIGRSLYYCSYNKVAVWSVGFVLYLLMLLEALLGYILPWHQMSFWAATVLSSVISNIPFVGITLYYYIVGGFGVSSDMLSRVYSCHIVIAFIILFFIVIHFYYLHKGGSSNPLFVTRNSDMVMFHFFYTVKDLFMLFSFLSIFCFMFMLFPDFVLDSESFIEANSLSTPGNIKPEWYFLCFYAMLRSVESKLGGLLLVLIFLLMLWLPCHNLCCVYSVVRQLIFWVMVVLFLLLTYLGSCHPGSPYTGLSLVGSFSLVFLLFIFKVPWPEIDLFYYFLIIKIFIYQLLFYYIWIFC